MTRGISFEIPNQYGSLLKSILNPIDVAAYNWYVGGEEAYLANNNQMTPLFSGELYGVKGTTLKHIIEQPNYYLIFVNLKAFPQQSTAVSVTTYDEFLASDCQLALLIIDSVYAAIYCKNFGQLKALYDNAQQNNFENVQYITAENDFRTRLSVW